MIPQRIYGAAFLCGVLLALPACSPSRTSGETPRPPEEERVKPRQTAFGKGQEQAPPQPQSSAREAPEDGKKGILARVFSSGSSVPGYTWDGQMSSSTIKLALPTAYVRAIETLRGLGFVLSDETKRQDKSGRVAGARADRTSALILLEEKTPGSTELKIRVGLTGDRSSSERILDEIQKPPAVKPPVKKLVAPAPK